MTSDNNNRCLFKCTFLYMLFMIIFHCKIYYSSDIWNCIKLENRPKIIGKSNSFRYKVLLCVQIFSKQFINQ